MASPLPGVWGIDVGQCAVKAVRLQVVEGEVTATAFDYIEYPKILNQPDADPDQLTREALEQFLARNKIRGDMVVISVPGQSGLARFVKLPPVEEKKVADIVRFEAKQQIPFPLEEVVWDFQKLGSGEVTDGFAMGTEIGLFALKRDMVFRYLQHFKDVNVEVHVVQMAPLALCNYVAYDLIDKASEAGEEEAEEKSDKKKCVVALDIGTDNSNLVITDGDRIIWQRPIPLGGNHFTRALTKDMKLTFAKAEHLKKNAVKSPDLKKILASLKTVLNDFVGEVQRSLGYFTNTHRDAQIQYMIGLGNAFRLPGLQKYLQEKLQLEVRKLARLERVRGDEVTSAPTFKENLPGFSVAYGLALQGLGKTRLQTNLLPYEVKVERLVRGKKPWAATAAACLALTVAGLTYARSLERAEVDDPRIKAASKAYLDAVARKTAMASAYAEQETKLREAKESIKRLAAGVDERLNWQYLHQYINMSLPQPNGNKLPPETRKRVPSKTKYFTDDAKKAYKLLEQKRFATDRPTTDSAKIHEEEEFIKKHLVQVNIEGISTLYSDDLGGFFRKIAPQKDWRIIGMSEQDRTKVLNYVYGDLVKKKDPLPQMNGWVVEVRGFSYHKDGYEFIEDTFLENLQPDLELKENEPLLNSDNGKEITARVRKRISYMFIYDSKTVPNPVPGVFTHIRTSLLPTVVEGIGGGVQAIGDKNPMPVAPPPPPPADKGPKAGEEKAADKGPAAGAKSRGGWTPLGQVAAGGMVAIPFDNNQGAANRQARTEFVLMFIWQEPFLGAP